MAQLAVELVQPRRGHDHVHAHQVVVLRGDVQAELHPDEPRGRHRRLLWNGEESGGREKSLMFAAVIPSIVGAQKKMVWGPRGGSKTPRTA